MRPPPNESARRARAGANLKLGSGRIDPLYLTLDGEAIAPLSVIIAAETSRRRETFARVVRETAHG